MELKDTTLRSIVFKQFDIELVDEGNLTNKHKVSEEKFHMYFNALVTLAKCAKLAYLDTGILRKVLLDIFPKSSELFNSETAQLIETYRDLRSKPSNEPQSVLGLPTQSFIIDNKNTKSVKKPLAIYVSTPKGLVFLAMSGSRVNSIFKSTDLIVAFKGTTTHADLSTDFLAQFSTQDISQYLFGEASGKKVASSFIDLLDDGIKILDELILKFKPQRLFLTGHSLGGAMSSIYSLICAMKSIPCSIHNVTFGSPTIFSSGLRNLYNDFLDSRKITLDRIVARMPSGITDLITGMPLGYSHPGFQPGTFEINPEKTGRVYNLDSIKKNYVGGSESKDHFHKETLTHMPNRLVFRTDLGGKFGHGMYLGIEFRNSFRKDKTDIASSSETGIFYCNIYEDGIRFNYNAELQLPKKT